MKILSIISCMVLFLQIFVTSAFATPSELVMNYLNTQNPNGEIRGPVIKGLQLGMDSDKAIPIFEKHFGKPKIDELVHGNEFLGMVVTNKDDNIKLYFDRNKNIVSIYYIGNGIDTAFGTQGLRDGFLNEFNKAYKLNLVSRNSEVKADDIHQPLLEISAFAQEIDNESLEMFNKVKDNFKLWAIMLSSMELQLGIDCYIDMNIKQGYIVKCVQELDRDAITPKEVDFIGIYAINKERQDPKMNKKAPLTLD